MFTMYEVVGDKWLLRCSERTVDIIEIDGVLAYSKNDVSSEILEVLTEYSKHNGVASNLTLEFSMNPPTLIIRKQLFNGLELKPSHLDLESGSTFTRVNGIKALVAESKGLHSELAKTEKRLDDALRVSSEMAEDKSKYQDTVLDKVCAILEERNLWIDKLKNTKTSDSSI